MSQQMNGASPDLIVVGRDELGKPQAARFPANQLDQVAKAATAMKLTVCKAEGAALAGRRNRGIDECRSMSGH